MTLKDIIQNNENIVFFGGAGVSTESGIPDFRSTDGLYRQSYAYPPETILSHTFFMAHTEEFFRFYRNKMIFPEAVPNITHIVLAQLEKAQKLKAVITQNIDGLHQMAGSRTVYELHGSVHRNYCMQCGKFYTLSAIMERDKIPTCTCGGIIKPDVVLYEEGLNNNIVEHAVAAIKDADVLIVGGTSLSVYPAAGLIRYYRGNKLILINQTQTPYDDTANIVINDKLGTVMGKLL